MANHLLKVATSGLGGILMDFVHVSVFSEWLDTAKGKKALGIIWTEWRVEALEALVFPLICQWLLEEHGFSKTFRTPISPIVNLLAHDGVSILI